jgi:hypothetical protein
MSNKDLSTGTSGLKSNYLSFIEVLAQAVGSIAPTASLALVIPLVSSYAGNGTWLAYLFALITTVLIGICLNFFTKRSASPGSLYSYVVKGLGAKVGIFAGWALLLAYVLTSAAVLDGFVNYANSLFSYGKIAVPAIVIAIFGAAIAWIIAFRDIKLSTTVTLILEFFSISVIVVLAVIVLIRKGAYIDFDQLNLKGVTFDNFRTGLVLAFFSFVGFESAASLLGLGKASRIEYRIGSSDADPYLIIAAGIASGIYGIEHKLSVSKENEVRELPRSLAEALTLFEKSKEAKELFGENFIQLLVTLGRHETELYNTAVTDWERNRYLEDV